MVPNSLSQPFILARTQPLLDDDSRATYLSIKSLVARLAFAASLSALSIKASASASMSYAEIQTILGYYLIGGVVILICLAVTSRALRLRA